MKIRLQPKQDMVCELMQATGPNAATVIGAGGAKGSGKSAGARNIAITLAMELGSKYPGIVITLVRRVAADLRDNHIEPMFRQHPELRAHWRATDHDLILPNRARILFRSAETADDVQKRFLGGFESAIIIVDEAQQFTQKELQWIQTAARWTSEAGIPEGLCKALFLFNPGGPGSAYIRRIFWLKQYEGKEQPKSFAFIHMFGWDNYEWFRGQVELTEKEFYRLDSETRFEMFISQTSEGRKYDAFPMSIRAGYLLGSFDHFEGQYFAGAWDERLCVVDRAAVERIVKPWWTRWMAQDWGFGDHDCHIWLATGKLSPSEWVEHFGGHTDSAIDICVIYREQVISDRAEADLAMDIVNKTPQHERRTIQRFFLSQDAFGQRSRQFGANTVGQQFTEILTRHGLPAPEPADQDRVNGWRFMYNCFRQANLRGTNFDEERASQGPACFVSTECPNVIESIPMAVRDDRKPEDVMRVEGALWEDVTDAVRYGLKSIQDVQWEAPYEVRRKQVYDTYDAPVEERSISQMTTLHMKMLMFDAEERARHKRHRTRR